MSWFKVDDQLHSHPKARRAGLEAMGLWVCAGSHCMAYKTDGFIPEWFVDAWPNGRKLAEKLVKAGLWSPATYQEDVGYRFHDWDDVQPNAETIERQREASRDRQRRAREAKRKREDDARRKRDTS